LTLASCYRTLELPQPSSLLSRQSYWGSPFTPHSIGTGLQARRRSTIHPSYVLIKFQNHACKSALHKSDPHFLEAPSYKLELCFWKSTLFHKNIKN
jgi:hypothetical protein